MSLKGGWHHFFIFVPDVVDQYHLVLDTALSFVATFLRREIMPQPARECPLRSARAAVSSSIRTTPSRFDSIRCIESLHERRRSLSRARFHDTSLLRFTRSHPHTISICSIFLEFERVAQSSSPISLLSPVMHLLNSAARAMLKMRIMRCQRVYLLPFDSKSSNPNPVLQAWEEFEWLSSECPGSDLP